MDTSPFTVALLEDEPGTCERLARALRADPPASLRWVGGSVRECLAWLESNRVDVVLVDLRLPDGSGLEVIRRCRERRWPCDVMVVTLFADEASLLQAFAAGASGYLLKDGSEADLARHVRALRSGGAPMSPMVARRLLEHWQRGGAAAGAVAAGNGAAVSHAAAAGPDRRLTGKESAVLALVARGFTYDETASRLSLSVHTVRTHVRNIYTKLDARNKTEALHEARGRGWIA